MAKKKKKPKQRHNARSVTKSPLINIERMWADKGVLHILKKNGDQTMLTVGEAASRAAQINAMPRLNPVEMKHRIQFVEQIVNLCREAKAQQEDKGDKVTQDLHNMLSGKLPDGSNFEDSKLNTIDAQLSRYILQYHTLSERDLLVILEDENLELDQKEYMMNRMHAQRLAEEGPSIEL